MSTITPEHKKDIWVLYHGHCLDGFASAWAAWISLGNSAHYRAVHHHTPLPEIPEGITLYLLDFCYPIDVLVAASKQAHKIIVLDHHISAQKDYQAFLEHSTLPSNLDITFIQEQSGCVITWHYFQGKAAVPPLLQHIEDHDLWRHELAQTEAICKALYLRLPMHFSAFEKIKLHTLKQEGAVLIKQQDFNVSRLLNAQHLITLNGVEGLAVNAPSMFSSDLGHALANLSGTFGLTYYYHGNRQFYACSLRSIGEFDVSELAKHFGGGGHQNASGFKADQKTFLTFLAESNI